MLYRIDLSILQKSKSLKKETRMHYNGKKTPKRKLKSMMLRYTSLNPDDDPKLHYESLDKNDECQSCGLLLMADYEYFR